MARLERKTAEHVAIAGLVVQVLGMAVSLILCLKTGCSCTYVLTLQIFISALVWAISLIRLRQIGLAEAEQAEWERLEAERAAGGAHGRLFEEDEIQAFSARNRLRILNKYITPIFSLGLGLALAAIVVLSLYFNVVVVLVDSIGTNMAFMMCVFGAVAFVFFLFARYAGGMSKQPEWRALRAPASFMMLNTLVAMVTALSHAVAVFGIGDDFDDPCAYAMLGVMGVLAIEIFVNFVLDFYRPRVEGVEERPAYDSRLLGLLLTPGGLLRAVSATLDYQFGFKVSQTWIYRFTEQWIAPLILFDLVTLYALTSFVVIGPEQQGVLERRGVFREVLHPGHHFTLPWPIERVYRFPANEVKTIALGHSGAETPGEYLLWTNQHYQQEFNTMVARRETDKDLSEKEVPVNLLVATTTIRYRIADVKKWYYSSSDPDKLLEALCEREQIKYLAGVDMFEVMSVGRLQAAQDLKECMQRAADNVPTPRYGAGLGVEILNVGVEGMHPPVVANVPESFHAVIDAQTEQETKRLQAEQEREKTLGSARSETAAIKLKAQSYYTNRVAMAEAEAKRFDAQNTAYAACAQVFKAREYFSALEKGLQDPTAATPDEKDAIPRKIVIGVRNTAEHVRIDLQDPINFDIDQVEFNKP